MMASWGRTLGACGLALAVVLSTSACGDDDGPGVVADAAHDAAVDGAAVDGAADAGDAGTRLDAGDASLVTTTTSVTVRVVDLGGDPLSGVAVFLDVDASVTVATDNQGQAYVQVGVGVPQTLRATRAGYIAQTLPVLLQSELDDQIVEITLLERDDSVVLANIENGGEASGRDGARVVIPPAGLVTADGTAVTGNVDVHITPLNAVANIQAFPGGFGAINAAGERGFMLSYGVADFAFEQDGAPLNLAPGVRAEIEIPIYATLHPDETPIEAGDVIALWSLDPLASVWIAEGEGVVVTSAQSPSGFALRASVGHFSWWNCDAFANTREVMVQCRAVGGTEPQRVLVSGTSCQVSARVAPNSGNAPGIPANRVSTNVRFDRPTTLIVPADLTLAWTATADNGTWYGTGSTPVGSSTEFVEMLLSPLNVNEPPDDGMLIAIETPHQDGYAVSPADDVDVFHWSVPADSEAFVSVQSTVGSALVGQVTVRNALGNVVCVGQFDEDAARTCLVSVDAAEPFLVEVRGMSATTGAYEVITSLVQSAPITVGVVETVTLAAAGAYTFELVAPNDGTYEVTLTRLSTAASIRYTLANLDLQVTSPVFSDSGLPLPVVLAAGQRLLVSVSRQGTNSVDVELLVSASAIPTTDIALPHVATYVDNTKTLLRVPLTEGAKLAVAGRPTAAAAQPPIWILDSVPVQVITATSDCGSSVPVFQAPRAGDFFIAYNSVDYSTNANVVSVMTPGTLNLGDSLFNTPATVNDQVLTYEVPITTTIAAISAATAGPSGRPSACVIGPMGARVQSQQEGLYPVSSVGTHYLQINCTTRAAGTFHVGVSAIDAPTPLTFVNGNATAAGSIEAVMGLDYYAVDLVIGDDIRMSAVADDGGATLLPAVRGLPVEMPFYEGTVWGMSGSNPAGIATLTSPYRARETGTHHVFVTTGNSSNLAAANTRGDYTLRVVRPVRTPLSLDTVTSFTLRGIGDVVGFNLDVPTDRYVRLRADFNGPQVAIANGVSARIVDAAGAVITSTLGAACNGSVPESATCFTDSYAFLTAGTYTVTLWAAGTVDFTGNDNFDVLVRTLEPLVTLDTSGDITHTDSIDRLGEVHYHRLTAPVTEQWTVQVVADNMLPEDGLTGRVYFIPEPSNGSRALPSQSLAFTTVHTRSVTAGQTYWLIVEPSDEDAATAGDQRLGAFTLTVNRP